MTDMDSASNEKMLVPYEEDKSIMCTCRDIRETLKIGLRGSTDSKQRTNLFVRYLTGCKLEALFTYDAYSSVKVSSTFERIYRETKYNAFCLLIFRTYTSTFHYASCLPLKNVLRC